MFLLSFSLILAGLACAGAIYILLPALVKSVMRKRFIKKSATRRVVFLTFDDGPNAHITPKIFDMLEDYHAKATFFLVGEKIKESPDIVRRLIAEGHAVGEHSFAHLHAWKTDPVRYFLDLWKCSRVLDQFGVNEEMRLFRPPYGKMNLVSLLYVWLTRRTVIFWSIDPKDFQSKSGNLVGEEVVRRITPGAVVLLHDGTSKVDVENGMPVVVNALERILRDLGRCGYCFAAMTNISETAECTGHLKREEPRRV